jgi:hypothetical protein
MKAFPTFSALIELTIKKVYNQLNLLKIGGNLEKEENT